MEWDERMITYGALVEDQLNSMAYVEDDPEIWSKHVVGKNELY
jgi:hypothetical protein